MRVLSPYSKNYWMRILLCLSFFISQYTSAQETVTFSLEKSYQESDYFPSIEGVFEGEISIVKLGSSNGIVTRVGWQIESFTISYPLGRDFVSMEVQDAVIPEELIKELIKGALKEQIFITNIIAVDEKDAKHLLKSMMLIPVLDEE